jgi:hypothetical protein
MKQIAVRRTFFHRELTTPLNGLYDTTIFWEDPVVCKKDQEDDHSTGGRGY